MSKNEGGKMSIKFIINGHKVAIYQVNGSMWTLIDGKVDYQSNCELAYPDGTIAQNRLSIGEQLSNVINYLGGAK